MRYLSWLLRLFLFLLLFAFALNNTALVAVQGLLGSELQLPLIVLILLCFALGVAAGVLVMLLTQRRLQRELAAAELRLKQLQAKPAAPNEVEPAAPLDAVL